MITKIYAVGWFMNVKTTVDGKNRRTTIKPDDDISEQTPEVKAACAKAWPPEVKAAYEVHKAEAI